MAKGSTTKEQIKDKKTQEKKVKKSGVKEWFKGIVKEFKNVRWPTKKEMLKYSIATIVFIIFFAFFFYILEIIGYFIVRYFG